MRTYKHSGHSLQSGVLHETHSPQRRRLFLTVFDVAVLPCASRAMEDGAVFETGFDAVDKDDLGTVTEGGEFCGAIDLRMYSRSVLFSRVSFLGFFLDVL